VIVIADMERDAVVRAGDASAARSGDQDGREQRRAG
jgi:hypothetical protein